MTPSERNRRANKRFDLACPVVVTDSAGVEVFRTRTMNISDGGMLLTAPISQTVPLGESVSAEIRLPRSTKNTFMFEDVCSEARVVRHQPMIDHDQSATAFQFAEPLKLGLEV